MSHTRMIAIAIFVVAAAGGLVVWFIPNRGAAEITIQDSSNIAEVHVRWQEELIQRGPGQMYEGFKTYYTEHPLNAHLAAHVVGELLYSHMKTDGFAICDDSFSSGCFHEVVGQAVTDQGIEVIETLGALCAKLDPSATVSCFHGIGHGAMAYFGYSDVGRSIDACRVLRTFSEEASLPCVSGALMEYYIPVDIDIGTMNVDAHPVDSAHPYDLCATDVIESSFKGVCYSTLPRWWDRQAHMSVPMIGNLCAGADFRYKESCYRGIAVNMVGDMSYDQNKIIESCSIISDPKGVTQCLRSSAVVLEGFKYDSCVIKAVLGERCE